MRKKMEKYARRRGRILQQAAMTSSAKFWAGADSLGLFHINFIFSLPLPDVSTKLSSSK
jgi:hypothetical protein